VFIHIQSVSLIAYLHVDTNKQLWFNNWNNFI